MGTASGQESTVSTTRILVLNLGSHRCLDICRCHCSGTLLLIWLLHCINHPFLDICGDWFWLPTCPREIGKEHVRLPVGAFPEGIGLWGLWSNEGFNDGFSIWLEVTELWKVQLDWRVWATREPHGSYSLLWPRPIVALLLAAGQDVSYSAEPSLLWWIAMSETMNSRNNSPIYLVSVRHSVKVTMKLTANFSKICSLRILSFSIQSFVQLQGLWSEVNRTGQVELLWRMTCVITQSSFSERWVLGTNLQIPEQGSFPCWLFPLFLTDSPQVKANWLMFRADWAFYALHSGLLRFLKTTSSCRKNICSAGDSQASLRVTDKWTACRAEAGRLSCGGSCIWLWVPLASSGMSSRVSSEW